MAFLAIKNRTDKPQIVQFDSQSHEIEKGQIVILDEAVGRHALKLLHFGHPLDEKNVPNLRKMVAQKVFELIPMEEALKAGAKMEESQAVVAERKRVEDEAAKKKALVAEIMGELKAAGWKAPEAEGRKK